MNLRLLVLPLILFHTCVYAADLCVISDGSHNEKELRFVQAQFCFKKGEARTKFQLIQDAFNLVDAGDQLPFTGQLDVKSLNTKTGDIADRSFTLHGYYKKSGKNNYVQSILGFQFDRHNLYGNISLQRGASNHTSDGVQPPVDFSKSVLSISLFPSWVTGNTLDDKYGESTASSAAISGIEASEFSYDTQKNVLTYNSKNWQQVTGHSPYFKFQVRFTGRYGFNNIWTIRDYFTQSQLDGRINPILERIDLDPRTLKVLDINTIAIQTYPFTYRIEDKSCDKQGYIGTIHGERVIQIEGSIRTDLTTYNSQLDDFQFRRFQCVYGN